MSRYLQVSIQSGPNICPFYNIYYNTISTPTLATLYPSLLPATGLTFTQLTSPPFVTVIVPDNSTPIIVSGTCGVCPAFTTIIPPITPSSTQTPTPTKTPTQTPTQTPTKTPTPTPTRTRPILFSGNTTAGSTSTIACGGTGVITLNNIVGNDSTFCNSTQFNGSAFQTMNQTTFIISSGGFWRQVFLPGGLGTTVATPQTSCASCTPSIFIGNVSFSNSFYPSCGGTGVNGNNVSGNSTTFCNSTGFISSYFTTLPNLTTTTIAFQGQYRVILTNGTNFAQATSNCISCPIYTPFIAKFRTTTQNESIKLPYDSGGIYNGTIDWGDGITSPNSFGNSSHIYSLPGIYTVRISGVTSGWSYERLPLNDINRQKIIEILQWGNQFGLYPIGGQFRNCVNLVLTGVTDILVIPQGLSNLSFAFANCTSLTTINNLNSWNVSSVSNMNSMFRDCISFNQNIGGWDVRNVMNMGNMFSNTQFNNGNNSSINDWITSAVTNMDYMFSTTPFNQNIGSWNVRNVKSMYGMFDNSSFNNGGNTSINGWVTSAVTNMSYMFNSATQFNQPIGNWDTGNVTNMNAMFQFAYNFNQPIGSWNVRNTQNMSYMFNGATLFNQPIGNWNVSAVTNFDQFMLTKTPLTFSSANLNSIYNGWTSLGKTVKPNLSISFGTAKYTSAGQPGRNILTSTPNNWIITDGGI